MDSMYKIKCIGQNSVVSVPLSVAYKMLEMYKEHCCPPGVEPEIKDIVVVKGKGCRVDIKDGNEVIMRFVE